jgi:serine/threonine protein kinase
MRTMGDIMLEPGTIITLELGQYRLDAPLAQSAYGVVWRARGPKGSADVALKLVNQASMERAEPALRDYWIASARNETAFLESLEVWDERHIVRLLDSGSHQGLPVMALELMQGDLGKYMASCRNAGDPVEFTLVLDWIGQINQALAKVHQYGWRYLDLKPANVLLDQQQRHVKLADFGTNRLLADLKAHSFAGTPNWQAPEQFFPSEGQRFDTDARSDYFALGAMFYYLVTGGLPLRFCSDCGQAWREHHNASADILRKRYMGAMPPTLRADEAALFVHRIDQQAGFGYDKTWSPSPAKGGSGAWSTAGAMAGTGSSEALTLLCSLLSADRTMRPRHALQISRMITDIRTAMSPESVSTMHAAFGQRNMGGQRSAA